MPGSRAKSVAGANCSRPVCWFMPVACFESASGLIRPIPQPGTDFFRPAPLTRPTNAVAPAYGSRPGPSLGGQPTGWIGRPANHSAARELPTCSSSQLCVF
jgi:hypothetical protein